MFLILLFCLPECIRTIYFEEERSTVPAILAEVYLTDIAPGNRVNLLALTGRAVEHRKQLYVPPVQKLMQ